MKKPVQKTPKTSNLIACLVVVLVGGILFIGAVAGWFNEPKVALDPEYYSENPELTDLSTKEYEELIVNKKSFLIFVDQASCTTADRLRNYVNDYAKEYNVSFYKMMFHDAKESTLHNYVKYYPSVVVVDKGKIRAFLKADDDADTEAYNNYDAFKAWLNQYL